jgi:hypothetical protein
LQANVRSSKPIPDRGLTQRLTLPAWALPSLVLWAVFPTGRRTSAKAAAFAAFIEDQLRRTNFAE